MNYIATTHNSQYFEITNELGDITGTLDCDAWTATNATITTANNQVYEIEAPNFWLTAQSVTSNGLLYVAITADPGFGLKLSFENGRNFSFVRQGILTAGAYMLIDEQGNRLAAIEADFRLRTLTHDYTIDMDINALDNEAAAVLPMLLTYCAKHMKKRY